MKNFALFFWIFTVFTLSFTLQGQEIANCHKAMTLNQLDSNRSVNWYVSGLRDTNTSGFIMADLNQLGIVNDGITPNDQLLDSILQYTIAPGLILQFPEGVFLFLHSIQLPSNTILRGIGPENSEIIFDFINPENGIQISGNQTNDTSNLVNSAFKKDNKIKIESSSFLNSNDWIKIIQNDSDWITSDWAIGTVGQIVQIDYIQGNTLYLKSELRTDFMLDKSPKVIKLNMATNVGIECVKLKRVDNTSPTHTSNIGINYSNNVWIKGIESENCNFAHIDIRNSSNILIATSYIHHSFEYGEDGRGYGVMVHYTTNECKVEDNIFNHLRHSMIVQAGANGNVFSFNYSFSPFWTNSSGILPSDAAGDMVLHGNYPYANLFEQNVCQNIVIDNSHGANGLYNTFLRNRCEKYGIFFSDATSPGQNFLGNEIVNSSFPYNLVNYTILGTNHFLYGNNNKGVITPSGTQDLSDSSYCYFNRPNFVPLQQWISFGPPQILNQVTENPAKTRYLNQQIFNSVCNNGSNGIDNLDFFKVLLYPNPTNGWITLVSTVPINRVQLIDTYGKIGIDFNFSNKKQEIILDVSQQKAGIYFLTIYSGIYKQTVKVCLY